jgi:hypothetical protein
MSSLAFIDGDQVSCKSLYLVIGDFFMILRLFKDVVFQIKNKKKQKKI